MEQTNTNELAEMTSEIVAAYVVKNSVRPADLPALIMSVHAALAEQTKPDAAPAREAEPLKPAVPIKKSVTDDYLISLFDGRKFKSLKRHLSAEHGMTPAEYRTMFGLPKDYPMVAPAYAKQRSSLAKSLGLGRRSAATEAAVEAAPEPQAEAPKKRSRAKAAAA